MMGALNDLLVIFEKIAIEYFKQIPDNVAKITINQLITKLNNLIEILEGIKNGNEN